MKKVSHMMAKLSQVKSHSKKHQHESIYRAPTGISVFRFWIKSVQYKGVWTPRKATLVPQGLQEEEWQTIYKIYTVWMIASTEY